MNLSFTVDHVNAGPAPFDVTATTGDGTELRIRFGGHPGLAAGDMVTVEFDQSHFPVIEEEPIPEPAVE